jgi:hypothetical protein
MSSEKCKITAVSTWDEAILDARQKVVQGKLYLARLKSAIKVFEKRKAAGDPWPTQSTTQNTQQQHVS